MKSERELDQEAFQRLRAVQSMHRHRLIRLGLGVAGLALFFDSIRRLIF